MIYKKRLKPNLALGQVRTVGSILTFPKLYPVLYSNHLTAKTWNGSFLLLFSPHFHKLQLEFISLSAFWVRSSYNLNLRSVAWVAHCSIGGMQLTLLIVSFQIKRIQNTQGKWKEISSLAFSSLYINLFVCNSAIALLLLFFSSLHLRRRKRKNPFL